MVNYKIRFMVGNWERLAKSVIISLKVNNKISPMRPVWKLCYKKCSHFITYKFENELMK